MKRENNPIPRFLFASLLSFPAQPSLLLVLSGCPLLALPSPQVCLPGLTPLGTLSLSLSDIITIRPRLYFLSPLSPFSLLLTSSHQFSPILWNISPPPHARLVCLSGLKGEQSLFDRSLPRSLVVEPPGIL